jgi:large subunit ribosomal protein L13
MKTTVTKPADIVRNWHLIDVENKILGRQSTVIAKLLMGKHKPNFSPAVDCGDYVIVINAAKVAVSGNKAQDKLYRHHTGRPGGFREIPFNRIMDKDPRKIIHHAIKGMLPKNKLRDPRLKRLKVFPSATHPYQDKIKSKEQ